MSKPDHHPGRRRFLVAATSALALSPLLLSPRRAFAREAPRRLSFVHTHTGERLSVVYSENGRYVPEALAEIDHLLRDFRVNQVHHIDPPLLDQLAELSALTDGKRPYEVICGYRCAATNAMLRSHSSGVAKHSLHMVGRAIDIRLPGVELRDLRLAALSMRAGGVGYYPKSDFIHIDTGRVRRW